VISGFGPTELIIVLVIVLLIFGPKRLPGLGRQLGHGMREFKDSITGKDDDDHIADEPERRHEVGAALGEPGEEPARPVDGTTAQSERTPQSS
jgi:sec-independent protein translocase protein TatA